MKDPFLTPDFIKIIKFGPFHVSLYRSVKLTSAHKCCLGMFNVGPARKLKQNAFNGVLDKASRRVQ